jgi:hypothetical protein
MLDRRLPASVVQRVDGMDAVLRIELRRTRTSAKLAVVSQEPESDPTAESVARDPFGANSVAQGRIYAARLDYAIRARAAVPSRRSVPAPRSVKTGTSVVCVPARFRRSQQYLLVIHDEFTTCVANLQVADSLIQRLGSRR